MKKLAITYLLCMILPLTISMVAGQEAVTETACQMVKIAPERLPDLTIPRWSSHVVWCKNGELTIFGGHTTGFKLTATAEYFSDGKWHLIPMTYNHDMGLGVVLSSGKVLLGGGALQNLGIGQTFETEVYDPYSHTFNKYGCLDKKRFHSAGVELDSGQVVITGNWYTKDGIETYDTLSNTFTYIKDVAQQRSMPYIFRIANDDVIILSGRTEHGDTIYNPIVDRLKGDPFRVPLLDTWRPMWSHQSVISDDSFIGDMTRGEYVYLLAVCDRSDQRAIVRVAGTDFQLLPTVCPIPKRSQWGEIMWAGSIIADRNIKRGYLIGHDKDCRQYILAIDYEQSPAGLTVYYTDPMPNAGIIQPVLTSDGDLIVVGGVNQTHNYFNPLCTVLRYRFGSRQLVSQQESEAQGSHRVWLWAVLLMVAGTALILIIARRRHKHGNSNNTSAKGEEPAPQMPATDKPLMDSIEEVMVRKQLFLNSNLKMSDVAAELGIHQNEVSACINSNKNSSFSQFVNGYRIDYAKKLIIGHPELKMAQIALDSGFSSDTSFFRTFKVMTGMTPKEWIALQDE
jgi:AraC-like DNA-binding protein